LVVKAEPGTAAMAAQVQLRWTVLLGVEQFTAAVAAAAAPAAMLAVTGAVLFTGAAAAQVGLKTAQLR
jgi:hypothetical protein